VHRAQALYQPGHLARQPIGGLWSARPHYRELFLQVGVIDPVIETPALERVVHLASAVRRDDNERGALGLDGSDLGDRDLKVGKQLEQERLELLIGAIDLVDQQDGGRGLVVVDRAGGGRARE